MLWDIMIVVWFEQNKKLCVDIMAEYSNTYLTDIGFHLCHCCGMEVSPLISFIKQLPHLAGCLLGRTQA